MNTWIQNAVIYHLFPLGALGAEKVNDFSSPVQHRLPELKTWIPYLQDLGVNCLLLGPVFESKTHGYDTQDYGKVDRRLGTNEDLRDLVKTLHDHGIRVLLDGVFNHCGRDFSPFQDLCHRRQDSPFKDWFHSIRFDRTSPYGDGFSYEGWSGYYELVKYNLQNPEIRRFLLDTVASWMDEFAIDGLRLDAADVLDPLFMKELRGLCKEKDPEFWLMGEVVHGDYRQWVNPSALDSVTNYEAYKGLWSAHNDGNYFEIAYSLERQFGPGGVYKDSLLYNFADNHDVPRISSQLKNPEDLYPLHCLLFTMPGVPSLYYGSETAWPGIKAKDSDWPLRPSLNPTELTQNGPLPNFTQALKKLIRLRQDSEVLKNGSYSQVAVANTALMFKRQYNGETLLVAVNGGADPISLPIPGDLAKKTLVDILNPDNQALHPGLGDKVELFPRWARVFKVQ